MKKMVSYKNNSFVVNGNTCFFLLGILVFMNRTVIGYYPLIFFSQAHMTAHHS